MTEMRRKSPESWQTWHVRSTVDAIMTSAIAVPAKKAEARPLHAQQDVLIRLPWSTKRARVRVDLDIWWKARVMLGGRVIGQTPGVGEHDAKVAVEAAIHHALRSRIKRDTGVATSKWPHYKLPEKLRTA